MISCTTVTLWKFRGRKKQSLRPFRLCHCGENLLLAAPVLNPALTVLTSSAGTWPGYLATDSKNSEDLQPPVVRNVPAHSPEPFIPRPPLRKCNGASYRTPSTRLPRAGSRPVIDRRSRIALRLDIVRVQFIRASNLGRGYSFHNTRDVYNFGMGWYGFHRGEENTRSGPRLLGG
ncbi:hypothetical protein FIBSPDRAFT_1026073 [Athelia psychrophila]|uniref:Uncharacterized protein n=1 Tax=Athelia psychrophila TaxID=1759441 RepID=A0A166HI92_9AGAM|nr:hypothetical protein FIBSPDRAFT_1026073 [Fibularhizoctonia sp. CBS 109695]